MKIKKNIWAGWLVWLLTLSACSFAGQVPELVADINQFTAPNPHPTDPMIDTTFADTVLVKDIHVGLSGSSLRALTNFNGTLFFSADDGIHGHELWKSDGTLTGTVLVKDIAAGGNSSYPFYFTNLNGTLFFSADDGIHGRELWKTDGTAGGTVLVKDIAAGGGTGVGSDPTDLANVNGTLFFGADDRVNGSGLWKSDGTAAGTVLVKNIALVVGGNSRSSRLGTLTNVNGTLFFRVNDQHFGRELWKSDGTAAGTVLLKAIDMGENVYSPETFTHINGTLFFGAGDDATGYDELWKSDGTAAGTVLVKDFFVGASDLPVLFDLTNVNGTLFFSAYNNVNGHGLWKSDGTAAGTVLLDYAPGSPDSSSPFQLTNVNGTLFFVSEDYLGRRELWKSDGTLAGTVLLDIAAGVGGSDPYNLTNVNGRLLFSANDRVRGSEVWTIDANGDPLQLPDIVPGSGGSVRRAPHNFVGLNDQVFFTANDGLTGAELWVVDLPTSLPPPALLQGNSVGGRKYPIKRNRRGAQSFSHTTASDKDYYLSKLVLHLSKSKRDPQGNLEVSLGTAAYGGTLSGSAATVTPGQIANNSNGKTFEAVTVTFATPIGPLASGQTYYINLESQNSKAEGRRYLVERSKRKHEYPGGTYYRNKRDSRKDAWFQVWGE